ncbi:helicase-related protein [Brevibacillus sp. NPDC003359]|uniref:helicase-related protein n=1 Tax=unclassified Brevibacillus TaxID=2684853 RepID=UPI00369AFB90
MKNISPTMEVPDANLTIGMQTPERNFEAILHFIVYDEKMQLLAASYMGYATTVKAISAGIIEQRDTFIENTRIKALRGVAYRKKERPIGIGDVYHGMILPRAAVWNDIEGDAVDGVVVDPVIIAVDGQIEQVIGRFLTKKFNLPSCWQDDYYHLLEDQQKEKLIVVLNNNFPIWSELKAVRLKVKEEEFLKKIEVEMMNGRLSIPKIDLITSGVFEPGWTLKEFIKNNAVTLATKLSEVRPYFDPDVDQLHWGFRLMKRIPFPAQAYKIQALVNSLLSKDADSTSRFDSSDMGTGKSITLCGVLQIYHTMKQERGSSYGTSCLLSAPAITLPKWEQDEIMPTIPQFAKITYINSTEDAIRLLNKIRNGHKPHKDDIEIYMVGLDRAKLGHEPFFSGIWKRLKHSTTNYAWHCPDCGEPIQIEEEKNYFRNADFFDFVKKGRCPNPQDIKSAAKKGHITKHYLQSNVNIEDGMLTPNNVPIGYIKKWDNQGKPNKCNNCQSVLWRPSLKSRHETRNKPRYNISKILKKTKKFFTFFAQDEVQQTRSESSGRGDAFAQMVKAGRNNLNLTGTLTTGKSTSIKEIIWRSHPQALLDEGFDHETGMIQWARKYGVLREVFEVEGGDRGIVTPRRVKALQPKEDPGIAPALVVNHLLHKSTFTELKDLGLPLVELHELPEIIEMDTEHRHQYRKFHERAFEESRKTRRWGKFIPSTINYGDRPDLGAQIEFRDKDSNSDLIIKAPPIPGKHAKLRRLIDIVKKELAEDRGIVIYTKYSDAYEMNEYLQNQLAEEGISSEILSSSTGTLQRFEWLERQAKLGTKVIICNSSIVQVGLDLLMWPTIIYYQLDYDINIVRQSSRRAWRIGQDRVCRVYYLVYDLSQQLNQFMTIMAKRGHAMLAEGRIDRSELAQYSRDASSAMAGDIADSLDGTSVAAMWKQLAAKDIDEGLELVNENDFKTILRNRMKELAEITLSRCLTIPGSQTNSNSLEQHLMKWLNYFATPWKSLLLSRKEQILRGIRENSILGFVYDQDLFYFDEVSTFGFGFVDEIAIVDHIMHSMGLTIEGKPIIVKKQEGQLSMLEIYEDFDVVNDNTKHRGRKKDTPAVGQLALKLFA